MAICRGENTSLGASIAYYSLVPDPCNFLSFSWHTAGINIAGSFILGGVTGAPLAKKQSPPSATRAAPWMMPSGLSPRAKLLLGVGFCGSFTTFSTFSVDIVTWFQNGQTTKAVSYVLTNNVGGVVAAAAGLVLVKKFCGSI